MPLAFTPFEEAEIKYSVDSQKGMGRPHLLPEDQKGPEFSKCIMYLGRQRDAILRLVDPHATGRPAQGGGASM